MGRLHDGLARRRLDDGHLVPGAGRGHWHLAYLQAHAGYTVKLGLPGLRGPEVELLYREGRDWLNGSPRPGVPR